VSLFISHFRIWLLALICIVVIEFTYYGIAHPPRVTWNRFLDLDFSQPETFQRLVAYDKIIAADKIDADIIQVGDSSGLHGVQPPIVMSEIPGYNYLNLSVATNLGFSGYYNMAKLQLKRNLNAQYLVLYTSPIGGVPRKSLWDEDQNLMAPLIYNEFISPMHRLVQWPMLSVRRDVTEYFYYRNGHFKQRNSPLSTNRGYLAFLSVYGENNGWTRETDVEGDVEKNIYENILPGIDLNKAVDPDVIRNALHNIPKVTDEKFFDWRTLSQTSYFDYVYDKFAELAMDHAVTLILIFNPLPQSIKQSGFDEFMDWNAIEAGLDRLRQRHPEVIVTDFDFWPDEKFSIFSHISTLFSAETSHRVGTIMKAIIGDQQPLLQSSGFPETQRRFVEIDFHKPYCGYGWTDQTGTTDKFPLQYIGPRNKAWIYTSVSPGDDYKVKAVFQRENNGLENNIKLLVNGLPAIEISSGREGNNLWIEWVVAEQTINMYRGWVTLEFDLGQYKEEGVKERKRTVAFQHVMIHHK
jgi:hypothetical protein